MSISKTSIVIHGITKSGLNFTLPILFTHDSDTTIEDAIIKHFSSQASCFEELSAQQGWASSYWTYPQTLTQFV